LKYKTISAFHKTSLDAQLQYAIQIDGILSWGVNKVFIEPTIDNFKSHLEDYLTSENSSGVQEFFSAHLVQ